MPSILRLRLIPQRTVSLSPNTGPAQGWFLALARQWDSPWAAILHPPKTAPGEHAPAPPRPPYTLASLHPAPAAPLWEDDFLDPASPGPSPVRRGEVLALRLALADDARARGLLDALPRLALPPLNGAPCRLARFPRPEDSDPDWLHAPWDVLADAPPAERLHVRFLTPTAFSRSGESLLLPEPARLLNSWRDAWEGVAPLPPGAADLTADGLRVTRYTLHTEPLSLKGGIRIGFLGEMELTWRPGVSPETRKALTALAGLADFLGTGAKTALGMGQTRVLVSDG